MYLKGKYGVAELLTAKF